MPLEAMEATLIDSLQNAEQDMKAALASTPSTDNVPVGQARLRNWIWAVEDARRQMSNAVNSLLLRPVTPEASVETKPGE